ncbi:MAG: signal peptidase I [Lachnospiraceae bacterium]|nr:signal peptidase I [Lachnospiraceae bacterium]
MSAFVNQKEDDEDDEDETNVAFAPFGNEESGFVDNSKVYAGSTSEAAFENDSRNIDSSEFPEDLTIPVKEESKGQESGESSGSESPDETDISGDLEEITSKSKRKKLKKGKEEGKSSVLITDIITLILCAVIAVAAAWGFLTFVASQTKVEGSSMQPTISDGDSVIVNKITYRFHDIKRYDIVVFSTGALSNVDSGNAEYLIKRVIGLPGDKIQIKDGLVYINGEVLADDTYGNEKIHDPGIAENEITLGEDMYFLLGDNRNMSTDSRNEYIGMVNEDKIVGKATTRIAPLKNFGKIK